MAMADEEPNSATGSQFQDARTFISPDNNPPDALVWSSSQERWSLLASWQAAVIRMVRSMNQLKVAWVLFDLVKRDCFCFATDTHFVQVTGMHITQVQRALNKLEQDGAIVRRHVWVAQNVSQRRIFLSRKIVERFRGTHAELACGGTREKRSKGTREIGVTESFSTVGAPYRRPSSTMMHARRYAALNAKKRGEG